MPERGELGVAGAQQPVVGGAAAALDRALNEGRDPCRLELADRTAHAVHALDLGAESILAHAGRLRRSASDIEMRRHTDQIRNWGRHRFCKEEWVN